MAGNISIKHLNCVVCARGFNSVYNDAIGTFPVYHPPFYNDKDYECENLFFDTLLRIYQKLHGAESSVPMLTIMQHFNWKRQIEMKKEMLLWCFSIGYLGVDSLQRLVIPRPVETSCTELFTSYKLDDPESRAMAIEFLRISLERLGPKLEPVPPEAIPITTPEEKEEYTFYAKMNTEEVEMRSEKSGMATANITGAQQIGKRRKER